jgi:enoyl-CoA hydratase/carnithine racemase
MTGEPLVVLEVQDGVGTLRLNRPPVNALNAQLRQELVALCRQAAESDQVRAVVVYGGPKHFAAGADIGELEGVTLAEMAGQVEQLQSSLGAPAGIAKPTIAAINGYALGGGLEIALACDFRIAGDKARLGLPEIALGVIPGGGGTQRLARLTGPSVAKNLLFTGRQVGAEEALRIGLVDEVVSADQVYERAHALAASLAQGPMLALRAAKLAVDEGLELSLESGLAVERAHFVTLFGTRDREIGMASFRESGPGKAVFVGR